jgi:hypothetical protein
MMEDRPAFATARGKTDTPVDCRTNKRSGLNPLQQVTVGVVARSGMIDVPAHTEVFKVLRSDTPA